MEDTRTLLLLDEIESKFKSAKELSLYRFQLLEEKKSNHVINDTTYPNHGHNRTGLASIFVPILGETVKQFVQKIPQTKPSESFISSLEVSNLRRLLTMYRSISQLDKIVDEELGMEGAHCYLSKVIKLDVCTLPCCCCVGNNTVLLIAEENKDTIMELQDMACEIASWSKSFPLAATPLTREELLSRLPFRFCCFPSVTDSFREENGEKHEQLEILINQVPIRQNAQKDVGFVMWPSAVVLSRFLATNANILCNKTVLELGAGCGLVGLVAAKLLQMNNRSVKSVQLTDCNDIVLQNLAGNIKLNELQDVASSVGLDFFEQEVTRDGWLSMKGKCHSQVDLILAADVICQPEDAYAVARTLACALKVNGTAIMVSADSKHRFGVDQFEAACEAVGCLSWEKHNVNHIYEDSLTSLAKTSGFVKGMSISMFTIQKQNKYSYD